MAVRLLFLLWKPRTAISADLHAWDAVIAVLDSGGNPYATGGSWGDPILRWLPFWLPILTTIRAVGAALGLSLTQSVQAFLIAAECGLIATTAALLRELGVRQIRALLLVGTACNPVCILLVVQHGNFDVLVGWAVVLFLLFLVRFNARGKPADWLLACLFLGIGIGLKTVPLVLGPLLLGNVRRLSRSERAVGAVLAIGLPLYALSVVYALAPVPVAKWVLGYRSLGGWFGVSGLLHFLRRDEWLPMFARLFALGMVGAIIVVSILVLRRRISGAASLVLTALLLLAAIPFVGPGYGPQYISWFWPLVLVSYATGSSRLREILVGFGAVAAATYLFEYALIEAQGAFWVHRFHDQTASLVALLLRTNKVKTLIRAPLFLAYASLLGGVALELRGRMSDGWKESLPKGLA